MHGARFDFQRTIRYDQDLFFPGIGHVGGRSNDALQTKTLIPIPIPKCKRTHASAARVINLAVEVARHGRNGIIDITHNEHTLHFVTSHECGYRFTLRKRSIPANPRYDRCNRKMYAQKTAKKHMSLPPDQPRCALKR